MKTIRILIADDHHLFREGVMALLAALPAVEVVAEAADGDEAVMKTLSLVPDVVLMDIKMPGLGGLEATRRILQKQPQLGILILTMFDDDEQVFAAMRAGARGYLLKSTDPTELARAIEAVAAGEALFSPIIAKRLLGYFADLKPATLSHVFPELTEREREILDLIAQGLGYAVIARRLGISQKTVRNHASVIFDKLQVAGRAEAMLRAREAGLGQGPA
jgi:DNA-binding NarL/FixJ family response regulator